MSIGLYAGSFNPWHSGHSDILNKALNVFDKVHVVIMDNPEKEHSVGSVPSYIIENKNVIYSCSSRTLMETAYELNVNAIIRGIRNGYDLEYEKGQMYWNEDIGLNLPFVYFLCDRKLSHVSSSALRIVNDLGFTGLYNGDNNE